MSNKRYRALETEIARHYRNGGLDANGHKPESRVSDGSSIPCRHCLQHVAKGDEFLVLAHRPFPAPQPYAEVGPIFLHAKECSRYDEERALPEMFLGWERIMLRGYGRDDRIVYGTGTVVGTDAMDMTAAKILENLDVVFIHVRSASNNCYQCRIEPVE